MDNMTATQILEKLENYSYEDIGFQEIDWQGDGFGNVVEVDEDVDQPEQQLSTILHFQDHDIYIRIDGYNVSHDGTYWEEPPYEVAPTQKTVTFYV